MEKTELQYKTIDEYISLFPDKIRKNLKKLRKTIKDSAPDAVEVISYQMPTFKLNGNLVHFAVMKNHIGFYPAPSAIIKFKKELSRYETSKGAIRFPLDQEIPFDLVKEMVKFRVKENSVKKK